MSAETGKAIIIHANQAGESISSKVAFWSQMIAKTTETTGPDPSTLPSSEYGHPAEGSLTAQRAVDAGVWVDREIDRLICEIKEIGKFDELEGGVCTTTFGELFLRYQDISNSVVGVLMRARKRKRVKFLGEMLYQHSCKAVKITVL